MQPPAPPPRAPQPPAPPVPEPPGTESLPPWTPGWPAVPAVSSRKERGGLLTFFILFNLVSNVIGIAILALGSAFVDGMASRGRMDEAVASRVSHAVLFSVLVGLVDTASLAGMWSWKKWGVYGVGGCILLSTLSSARQHSFMSWFYVINAVCFVFMLLPRWKQFE